MKYPPINKQPHREVNIPEMSGGLNMRDSVSSVIDNQLTDSLNVWFRDGALRTRPSFATNTNMKISNTRISSNNEIIGFKPFPDIKNGDCVLVTFAEIDGCDKDDITKLHQCIRFWWQGKNGMTELPILNITVTKAAPYFVIEKDGTLYCYLSAGDDFKVYKRVKDGDWSELGESNMYAPIVYSHCLMTGPVEMLNNKPTFMSSDYTATQFEGLNLLGNRYRAIYSTVNRNLLSANVTEIPMRYTIPGSEMFQSYDGKIVIAKIMYADGVATHIAEFKNGSNVAQEDAINAKDNLRLNARNNQIWFDTSYGEEEGIKYLTEDDYIEDNLEITISFSRSEEKELKNKRKVFCMTRSTWFGGSANGLSDGSRLFLCGNTNESEQSLVLWSGLNDPTYFPENNCVYVGNKTEPVKAFGKQDNKLVVFKPNETYYTYYVQNNNITAEDLINQTVVDYQANSVYFPFVLLNGSIGCDCPDTVQLCRNRLVWSHSKGKVYTLVSDNQYSENSIYPVAEMVERGIGELKDYLPTAQSCDFDGHYVLILGQDAFVMDYNSYGYQYVHSYSKSEDANVKIPWYRWKLIGDSHISFGENIAAFYSYEPSAGMDGIICASVLSSDNINSADQLITFDNTNNLTVTENPIISRFTTKLFDFSGFRFRKNVDRVSIGFGNNGGIPITVRFITDVGTEEENVSLAGNELTAYRPSYITVKQFNPCIRSVIRFGVEVECNGLLAVDAINLSYRLLGGAR